MSINMSNLVIWSSIDLTKYFTEYGSAWHQENKKITKFSIHLREWPKPGMGTTIVSIKHIKLPVPH